MALHYAHRHEQVSAGLGFWKALEKTLYTTIQYIPLSAARDQVEAVLAATVVALPWGC